MKTERLPKGSLKNAVIQVLKTPPIGNIAEIARQVLPKIIELGIKATEASLYQCIRNWSSSASNTTERTDIEERIVPVTFSDDVEVSRSPISNRGRSKPMDQLNEAYDRIEEAFCNLETEVRSFLKNVREVLDGHANKELA